MNKSKLIRDVLKFKHRHSQRASIWLKNENLVPVAQSAISAIDKYNEAISPHNVVTLKHCAGKRVVFCINAPLTAKETFVVKVFPLRRLKHRLRFPWTKHSRYAFNEAANLIIAAKRGVRVPKVYGYGCIYDSHHLTKASLVLLEYLAQHTSADQLLKLNREDEKECARILDSTIPIFISLHEAYCNIVYILSDAIMLGGEDSKQDPVVLDFEYARFYDKPSLEVLVYEAAYFAQSCPDWLERRIVYDWFAKLLDAVAIRDEGARRKLTGRFDYYLGAICHMSHKEAVNIR